MKPAFLELSLLVIAIICIHTVRVMHNGKIQGNVYPASMAQSVVAVKGQDSVVSMSSDGHFGMEVPPGVWKVVVAFKNSNRNIIRDNVEITEGEHINLGEIRLQD